MALGALAGTGTAAGAAEDPGGVGFAVNPTAGLQFGDVQLAHSSERQLFDVVVPAGWTLDDVDTQAGHGNLLDFQLDTDLFHACAGQPGPTPCAIGYSFVPSRLGAESATAEFEFLQNGTTDVFQPISRPLPGTGIATGPGVSGFSVSPSKLNFGDQTVGAQSAPKTVGVDIPAGWSLADFQVGDGDVGDFDADVTQFQACANTPGPTQCAIGVTFTPRGTGTRSAKATLDITPTPGGGAESKTITLEGHGVSPGIGGPDFSVTPTPLVFGDVALTDPPAVQYVTVNIPEGWEFLASGVGDPGDFGIDIASFTACDGQRGPSTCQIGFAFSPTVLGPQSGSGEIAWGPVGGGLAENVSLPLRGTGVQPGSGGPGLGGPRPGPGAATGGAAPPTPAPAAPAAPLAAPPRFTG